MKRSVILAGQSKDLQPLITQLMAFYQLLEELDVDATGDAPSSYVPERANKPEVILYFREDSSFVPGAISQTPTSPKPNSIYKRMSGRISFRLMDEKPETFTEGNATNLANKIKQTFGANGGYIWKKGKEMYSYTDWERGYQLQIIAKSKTQAKDLVTKVLSLQNHTPVWKLFNTTSNEEPEKRYPTIPPKLTTLGQTVDTPRERPVVDVRFQYAVVHVAGLIKPVTLYDRRGKKSGALVT